VYRGSGSETVGMAIRYLLGAGPGNSACGTMARAPRDGRITTTRVGSA
jgi:hypothetical protein